MYGLTYYHYEYQNKKGDWSPTYFGQCYTIGEIEEGIKEYHCDSFADLAKLAKNSEFEGVECGETFFRHLPAVRICLDYTESRLYTEKNFDKAPHNFRIRAVAVKRSVEWLMKHLTMEQFAKMAKENGLDFPHN